MTDLGARSRSLVLGTTALALLMSINAAVAQSASGGASSDTANQTQAADLSQGPSVETVVVTGSHIHGVSVVGSSNITLGQNDLLQNNAPNAQALLDDQPQVTNIGLSANTSFGGTRSQGAGSNQQYQSSINLRGVGIEATLTMVNGQRVVTSGQSGATDPNIIPPDMLQRIDVQADGGSAIYGSDAIAGTVNLVLRDPIDIIQATGQYQFKRGEGSWQSSLLLGKTWTFPGLGDGGILFDYAHDFEGSSSARDLSYAYNDNLVPYIGATGLQSTSSSPGNVSGFGTTAAQQSVFYAVPKSGIASNGQLTLAQLGPAGQPNYSSLYTRTNEVIPQIARDSFMYNMKQDILPWLHFFSWAEYNHRGGTSSYGSTPQPQATITVPNTNPYSPCATPAAAALAGLSAPSQANSQGLACPANGSLKVAYDFVNELGAEERIFSEKNMAGTVGFNADLPFDWKSSVTGYWGRDIGSSTTVPTVNSTALAQAVSGIGLPSGVPYFNPFCSDQNGPCNSAATDIYIQQNPQSIQNPGVTNGEYDLNLHLDGPIFDLPGGAVRLALGVEYTHEYLDYGDGNYANYYGGSYASNVVQVSTVSGFPSYNDSRLHRTDRAAYAELYVPIISPDMDIPLVNKLEVSGAVRYSYYSLGSIKTTNPKYGFNYYPIEDLKVHGSYGTSFKAPTLAEADTQVTGGLYGVTNTYTCGQYPGINAAACPAGGNTPISAVAFAGGNPNLQPQKGRSWSLGADWTPKFLPGFTSSVNWYRLIYSGQISQPGANGNYFPYQVVNSGYFNDLVAFNPTYFPKLAVVNSAVLAVLPGLTRGAALTQAQYNSLFPTLAANPVFFSGQTPSNPLALISDGLNVNTGSTDTDGLDLSSQYLFDTGWGLAHVGYTATFVDTFQTQISPASPTIEEDNEFGFVVRWRGRLQGGLDNGPYSGTLFMNYVNPYHVPTTALPAAALNYGTTYENVSSSITWDISLGYSLDDLGNPLLDGTHIQLYGQNILDKKPPFVLNGAGQPALLYDPNEASALGATWSLRLVKEF